MQKFRPENAKFVRMGIFLYLCSVKRIEYISPIDYMRGNLSGRQLIKYDGADAYSIADGEVVAADGYQPRLIAQVKRLYTSKKLRIFQVRTRTSVNMTNAMRVNMAVMGGAGAIFAAIVSDKTAQIYIDCVNACPQGKTLRAFIIPALRAGLAAKVSTITIAGNVCVTNPWVSTDPQTVNISPSIKSKFNNVLSI